MTRARTCRIAPQMPSHPLERCCMSFVSRPGCNMHRGIVASTCLYRCGRARPCNRHHLTRRCSAQALDSSNRNGAIGLTRGSQRSNWTPVVIGGTRSSHRRCRSTNLTRAAKDTWIARTYWPCTSRSSIRRWVTLGGGISATPTSRQRPTTPRDLLKLVCHISRSTAGSRCSARSLGRCRIG